MNVRHQTDSK